MTYLILFFLNKYLMYFYLSNAYIQSSLSLKKKKKEKPKKNLNYRVSIFLRLKEADFFFFFGLKKLSNFLVTTLQQFLEKREINFINDVVVSIPSFTLCFPCFLPSSAIVFLLTTMASNSDSVAADTQRTLYVLSIPSILIPLSENFNAAIRFFISI